MSGMFYESAMIHGGLERGAMPLSSHRKPQAPPKNSEDPEPSDFAGKSISDSSSLGPKGIYMRMSTIRKALTNTHLQELYPRRRDSSSGS